MKKILCFLFAACFIALSFSNAFSQLRIPQYDNIINPVHDYYSLNYPSVINAGKGNAGAASTGDVTSALINPASLTLDNKYQAVLSYGIKTSYNVLTADIISQIHPSFSAGAAFKVIKGLNAGIVYSNRRNMKYSANSGTGYVVDQIFNEHVFSIPISFEYDILRAGIGLNLRLMHGSISGFFSTVNYPDGAKTYGKTDKILFTPDFGVIINPWRDLSLGVAFSPAWEFDNNWEYDTLLSNMSTTSRFPLKITAGTEFRLPREGFSFSLDYVFEKMSDYTGYENRNNINFGAEFEASKYLTIRTGFFTLNTQTTRRRLLPDSDNQFFLTAGGSYKYKNVKFNAALLTSSVINQSDISHTIINFGAAYEF